MARTEAGDSGDKNKEEKNGKGRKTVKSRYKRPIHKNSHVLEVMFYISYIFSIAVIGM